MYFGLTKIDSDHGRSHLMQVRLGGHAKAMPVPGGTGLVDPSVSPDGRTIVAVRRHHGGRPSLVTLSLKSGKVRTLLWSAERRANYFLPLRDPQYSPNGKRIVVVAGGGSLNRAISLDVIAGDGSDHGRAHQIAYGGKQLFLLRPFWRTNHEIWFGANVRRIVRGKHRFGNYDLFAVRLHHEKASVVHRLTRTATADERDPSFAR